MYEIYSAAEVKGLPFTIALVIAVNKVPIRLWSIYRSLLCSVVMFMVTDRYGEAGLSSSIYLSYLIHLQQNIKL